MDIIAKTREDYNRIAKHFSATRQELWPELLGFKKYVKVGDKVLDWGCGNGRLLSMLKNFKIEYFGVDQSVELLKLARQRFAPEIKTKKVKFFSNASRPKKFPKDYFDIVYCIAVLFHLPDEATRLAQLQEFYNEMKPGAKVIVMVWNLGSDWAKVKSKNWQEIAPNDFLIPWKNPQGEKIVDRCYHHFTEEELVGLMKRAGFKKIKIKFMNNGTWTDDKGGRNMVAVGAK
ncbi:MAG: hypothetical protein A3J93_01350 [Candidatus Magasanikbacteria bacterium RIFOXYC2_FULL_42_28]|uniref:Methyltransferase domain-containing protein n=1 Tax=Candidatus Magasanikbacteria bacterium RIFOXYC2_FULL_42_28 TaxID=1798704 RepID=A0A1F6NYI9_9BACT|nr:MAG: hypothetical protein A3J93_01350 [Candidatus Magasanikbacteria bacterium RIFOXYC2_FULL_42_28]